MADKQQEIMQAVLDLKTTVDFEFDEVKNQVAVVDKSLAVMFERMDNHLKDKAKHLERPCEAVAELKEELESHKKNQTRVLIGVGLAFAGSLISAVFAFLKAKVIGG